MTYFIETQDKPDHQEVRQAHRSAHLDYLEANRELLLACGAKLNEDGSDAGGGIYIVAVETHDEAQRFIHEDPFHKDADLFESVRIVRWRKAYVDGKCLL